MTLTIYFKNTGSKDGHTYYFSEREYLNFRTDFESYVKTGMPKGGTYVCRRLDGSDQLEAFAGLMVEFDSLAFIDLQVRMDKLNELFHQGEEIKHKSQQA